MNVKLLAFFIMSLVCLVQPQKSYCIDDTNVAPISSEINTKILKAIVFDVGNVFVKADLNPRAWATAFKEIGVNLPEGDILKNSILSETFYQYSEGRINTKEFIEKFSKKLGIKEIPEDKFKVAWNSVVLSVDTDAINAIPEFRALGYRIYALSDNNAMHTDKIEELFQKLYSNKKFFDLFDKSYLSQETHYRKATDGAWLVVLKEQHLKPEECLFIDDVAHNINRAKKLGFQVLHYTPETNMKAVLAKISEASKK